MIWRDDIIEENIWYLLLLAQAMTARKKALF